ncbi:MAG: S9 family peptidase [Balneolaceae bacterium]|nr:MAG: S9 family peptidase [Balneolaceae bacterium]
MAQKLFLLSISLTFILYTGSFASENDTPIVNWLLLGPVETQLPIYHDQKNVRNESFTLEKLLSYEAADITGWVPENGATVRWSGSSILQWSSMQADTVELSPENEEKPANAWAAFYLDSDRFSKASLTISSHHPFVIYVNGHNAGTKQESESGDSDPGSHTEEIVLTQGKHLVLVRTLYNPEINASWSLSGTVSVNGKGIVSQSLNPERFLDLETLSNQPQLGSLAISADGSLAAMRISFPAPPEGTGDSWLEIRETASGNLLREYKGGMDFGSLQWAPEGRKFTYTESSDGKTSLWLADLETGSQLRLLKNVSDFGSYRWSPDGSFILYAVSERPDSDDSGVRLLNDLEERRPWHFTRSFLYKVNVPEGTTQRLTAGLLTTSLHDISPDGSTLLYSRSHTDYSVRPYSVSEYQLLNIETLERDSLFSVPFGGSGRFSPDGNTILFTGGPSMFGETGTSVPDGMVANDYDTQAYLYDIQSGDIRPISREFDPAIDQAMWGGDSNTIFMITTDQSYRNLYRYDVRQNQYTKINAQTEVLAQVDISKDGRTAIYSGTGISQPVQAYSIDLRRGRSTLLRDPGSDYFKHVAFGEEKTWTFTTSEGRHIDGYVYYPPDFDPGKSYPVIANYYGGTFPVNRAFGGRYPKELYAAKGYIVYVMQPSGATGYGQEFSALHVNDWGIIVADEIIEGVNQFLDAHPYADRERVGAIGASYGGFMTMLLMTRTDIFAAGVSHAGISNIASYWGEGFWGFQYSAYATANSFPWNREDIYVGQSPLYAADRVTTPLLFLTGMQDTNVPPGESLQMYTALKLLGKETAFIAVDEQDHHILDYNKYKLWKASILSWFDKHLKGEPDWWEHKYGE